MSEDPALFRNSARSCRELAAQARNEEARRDLLEIAFDWNGRPTRSTPKKSLAINVRNGSIADISDHPIFGVTSEGRMKNYARFFSKVKQPPSPPPDVAS